MKKLIKMLFVSVLSLAATHASSSEDETIGRYIAVTPHQGEDIYAYLRVWIVDTATGQVKQCYKERYNSSPVECTKYSPKNE